MLTPKAVAGKTWSCGCGVLLTGGYYMKGLFALPTPGWCSSPREREKGGNNSECKLLACPYSACWVCVCCGSVGSLHVMALVTVIWGSFTESLGFCHVRLHGGQSKSTKLVWKRVKIYKILCKVERDTFFAPSLVAWPNLTFYDGSSWVKRPKGPWHAAICSRWTCCSK